ncbi:hypothetical protein [Nostoc sp. ChiQUE01b]|uniref:hypothetical protein n=1 Tax=Nostoc sp. ChiQUE01b TaxID=3075376 RepID=UPI002AD2130A|nr:hypothetical protein [Nostoc sp. ChiQUE01b]
MCKNSDGQRILSARDLIESISRNECIEPIDDVIVEGDIQLNSVNYDHKLVIHNTSFRGRFDVSEAHFSRTLDLSKCVFERNVNFCDVQIERNLILTEAKIKADNEEDKNLPNFERIHVQGWINAKALKADVKLNFNHSHIGKLTLSSLPKKRTICKEDVSFIGAKVLYDFDCSGIKIVKELVLQGIDIQGEFFCNTDSKHSYCTEIDGGIFMLGAKILGRADFSGAQIGSELNLELCEIQGGLDFQPEFDQKNNPLHYTKINGDINLGGCKISPSIHFNGATIHGNISLQIAKIKGNIFFCNPDEENDEVIRDPDEKNNIDGKIDFSGIQITGSVYLSGTKICGDIDFKGANIKGNICCRSLRNHRTEFLGKVNLVEVEVQGSLDFSGAKISGDIDLKRATIKSKIDCEMSGDKRTEISGNFNCAGARVTGTISLNSANIAKDAVFKGIEVLGSIDCKPYENNDTEIINNDTEINGKLNLIRARISSSVNLEKTTIIGGLKLKGAEIGNDFSCNLSKIINASSQQQEANFQECIIHSLIIHIDNKLPEKSTLNLAYTKVIKFKITGCLPHKKILNLEGFEFKQLELPEPEVQETKWTKKRKNPYIKFLDATTKFNESTYIFMENWLQNQGAQIDANYVYVAMQRRNRRERISTDLRPFITDKNPEKNDKIQVCVLFKTIKVQHIYGLFRLIKRLWLISGKEIYDGILDFTIRYGTATNRLFFFYFLPVLMFSWLLFNNPNSVELEWTATVSDLHNPKVVERINQQKQQLNGNKLSIHPKHKDWTSMDAFLLAVKITLPVIQFPSTDKWVPSSQPVSIMFIRQKLDLISYDIYAKFITLFSWVTVPLFLAGISGIVKTRQ